MGHILYVTKGRRSMPKIARHKLITRRGRSMRKIVESMQAWLDLSEPEAACVFLQQHLELLNPDALASLDGHIFHRTEAYETLYNQIVDESMEQKDTSEGLPDSGLDALDEIDEDRITHAVESFRIEIESRRSPKMQELVLQETRMLGEIYFLIYRLQLLIDAQSWGGTADAVQRSFVNIYSGFGIGLPNWLQPIIEEDFTLRKTALPNEVAHKRVELWRGTLSQEQYNSDLASEVRAELHCMLGIVLHHIDDVDTPIAQEEGRNRLEEALRWYQQDHYPLQWARVQAHLGWAYAERVGGDRAENIERAIDAYQLALQVITAQRFPDRWALLQRLLAAAFVERLYGDPAENAKRAAAYAKAATEALAPPEERAAAQVAWANAERYPLFAARQDELFMPPASFDSRTRFLQLRQESTPVVEKNLMSVPGIHELEHESILIGAMMAYNSALDFYSPKVFPSKWARTIVEMGTTIQQFTRWNQYENILQAIVCFRLAQQVYTQDFSPRAWADVQLKIGQAYLELTREERFDIFGMTASSFLTTWTMFDYDHIPTFEDDHIPTDQQLAANEPNSQGERGKVLARVRNHRDKNLALAVEAFSQALQVFMLEQFPSSHRQVAKHLAVAQATRGEWAAAQAAYASARAAEDLLLAQSTGTRQRDLITRDGRDMGLQQAFALTRLGSIPYAVLLIEQVRTRDWDQAQAFFTLDPQQIEDVDRRARYVAVQNRFLRSQTVLQSPLSEQLSEDEQRREHLKRMEEYRSARDLFERVDTEIRTTCDLSEPPRDVDLSTILRATTVGGPRHAVVYLLTTPWGGIALGAFGSECSEQQQDRFGVLDLPECTDRLMKQLLQMPIGDGTSALVGGYAQAQIYEGVGHLAVWPGPSLSVKMKTFHTACQFRRVESMLDDAARTILNALPLVEQLAAEPLEELGTEQLQRLNATLSHAFLQRELRRVLPVLSRVIVRPLVAWLQQRGVETVTLIPCGYLSALPLLAAPVETKEDEWTTLCDVLPASVAPSARSLLHGKREDPTREGIYALGNPHPTRQELEWGEAEALTLSTLGGNSATCAIHQDATRNWLVHALNHGQVVDAACHGVFDHTNFLQSSLLLAQGGQLTLADALNGEIARLHGLRLLILSACQTGIIDLHTPDEVRSLAVGMLQAGAAAVLGSLWPVDDRATYLLMVRFAQEWFPHREHEAPVRALARAQQWLRSVTWQELSEWEITNPPFSPTVASLPSQGMAIRGQGHRLVSEEELLLYQPRYSMGKAQGLIQSLAKRRGPEELGDVRPYADPIYWAAFCITGW
jgi:CHAT domain-containing protein